MKLKHSGHRSFQAWTRRFAAALTLTLASLFSLHSLVAARELIVTPGLTLASAVTGQPGEIRLALEGDEGVPDVSDIDLPSGIKATLTSFSLSEFDLTLRLTPTAGTDQVAFDTLLITYRDGIRDSIFIGPTEVNWLEQTSGGRLANPEVLATPSEQVPISILLHNQGSEPLVLTGFHYAPEAISSGRVLYGSAGYSLDAIHAPVLRAHDEQVPRYPILPPMSLKKRLGWPLRTARFTPPAPVQWLDFHQTSIPVGYSGVIRPLIPIQFGH